MISLNQHMYQYWPQRSLKSSWPIAQRSLWGSRCHWMWQGRLSLCQGSLECKFIVSFLWRIWWFSLNFFFLFDPSLFLLSYFRYRRDFGDGRNLSCVHYSLQFLSSNMRSSLLMYLKAGNLNVRYHGGWGNFYSSLKLLRE